MTTTYDPGLVAERTVLDRITSRLAPATNEPAFSTEATRLSDRR
jgi:hypothetical protein